MYLKISVGIQRISLHVFFLYYKLVEMNSAKAAVYLYHIVKKRRFCDIIYANNIASGKAFFSQKYSYRSYFTIKTSVVGTH